MTVVPAKGWCPGAYRPMMSGDGLIVRVRPRLGCLTAIQVLGLCEASQHFGNGIIDLTSRANLQLRGVDEKDHAALMQRLDALELLDADPEIEVRRNIIVSPFWEAGDLTVRLHGAISERLADLPALPAKMGVCLDTGKEAMLRGVSADFRFELSMEGVLLLRADGASEGHPVAEADAGAALIEMAEWFCKTGGIAAGRMSRHLKTASLPDEWHWLKPRWDVSTLSPGASHAGLIYGAPFGSLDAKALRGLFQSSNATALRVTPWRLFLLEDAEPAPDFGFVINPGDPLLQVHACPGAPACSSATVATRDLARKLAARAPRGLHVSGCAKGCAHPRATKTTLVGRDGGYDLVKEGCPWDAPLRRAVSAEEMLTSLD